MKFFLSEIRMQKNLSVRALSELSTVSVSQIENIENGTANPKIETICKLAKALEVPADKLYCCEG